MNNTDHLNDDRPIEQSSQDKLGFGAASEHLATTIINFSSPEGFVLGLEGEWGSGKSSLVNLIENSLAKNESPPEIVKFSPWLISTREGLLIELFGEIAKAAHHIPFKEVAHKIEKLEKWKSNRIAKWIDKKLEDQKRRANRKSLRKQLIKFTRGVGQVGQFAVMGEIFGFSGSGIIGRVIDRASKQIEKKLVDTPLETQKENLQNELRKLSRQIVIFIDDLDRLNPKEAGEIMRLVRAVADFPNIVYVLCYSRSILAQSLSKAYKIKDGATYIEKIVQASYTIPKPEEFDLRYWLKESLNELFSIEHPDSEGDEISRLEKVIDIQGGIYLETPRDVVRAINALRLYAAPIRSSIDLADMVFLQLVRIKNAELYSWIERYVNNCAAIYFGGSVSDEEATKTRTKLDEILKNSGLGDSYFYQLENILPAFKSNHFSQEKTEKWTIFNGISGEQSAVLSSKKRLGSPHHFKFYFSFSKPGGTLYDSDVDEFITSLDNNFQQAKNQFIKLANTKRPQGGNMAEILLDRIMMRVEQDKLPVSALENLIICLSDVMDIGAVNSRISFFNQPSIWRPAETIFEIIIRKLPSDSKEELIGKVFKSGDALGWLSKILRTATFSLGIYGDKSEPEDQRLFTIDEYTQVSTTMRTRFCEFDAISLMNTPSFINLMFAWKQTGPEGEKEASDWIFERQKNEEEFLLLLEKMTTIAYLNGTRTNPISERDLKHFLNFDKALVQVKTLTEHVDSQIRKKAENVLHAMKSGQERW